MLGSQKHVFFAETSKQWKGRVKPRSLAFASFPYIFFAPLIQLACGVKEVPTLLLFTAT